MQRFTISKSEKQTIFEIYRACRLCGAGGGYRMPIIQNIVDLDGSDVELRQKIQDCLQLEVRSDDRMPPLICEICVEKVNDFYEFMEMTRQTNIRTRTRLGLPLQTARKGEREESDNGDCILGVAEPLHEEEPVPKKSKAGPRCSKKIENEVETVKVKEEVNIPSPKSSRTSSVSSRSSKASKRASSPPPSRVQPRAAPKVAQQINPTPPQPSRSQPTKSATPKVYQVTQEKKGGKDQTVKEKEIKESEVKRTTTRKISSKELEDLIKDNINYEENSLLVPRAQKRVREHELPKPLIIPKRPKTIPKEPVKEPTPPPRPKPRPKSKQDPKNFPVPLKIPKPKAKLAVEAPPKVHAPKSFHCVICNMHLKTVQAHANHTKYHVPNYTKPQNACNPCGKWFPTTEEANTHHRYHRAATFPYHCRRCFEDYHFLPEYDLHIANNQCVPWETVPDVKCEECWKTFPTQNLKQAHKCPGVDARPGGKCSKCPRTYATLKSLKKHESTCNQKRKRDLIADPDVLRRLKPMQVRIARCDDLLTDTTGDYYNVSGVKPNHGLDRQYVYPYMTLKIKSEPLNSNSMVAIRGATKPECERDSYTHWDSEDSDDDGVKEVDSLVTLSIKKLFSTKLLGKVPRKRRKVKNDDLDCDEFDDISRDINIIINSLDDDSGCYPLGRHKNELLMASLNDIIGVPNSNKVENENVVVSENDININQSKTAYSEKSEFSNVSDSVNDAQGDDSLSKDRGLGNEIVDRNENDNLKMNESKTLSSEKSEVSTISDSVNDAVGIDSLSKDREPENEIAHRNENDDLNINESKTVLSEKSELSNMSDSFNDAEGDDRLSKDREPGNEILDRNENDDSNINESKTVSCEKSELSNISATVNNVEGDDSLSKDRDTGNEVVIRNEHYVNINESKTVLTGTNKNDAEDHDMVTEHETADNENNTNTNDGNENQSENALNYNSEVSNLMDTEMGDEVVNVAINSVSNVSTNPHLIETKDVDSEQSNDTENICYEKEEQVLINQLDAGNISENATEILNRFENIEDSKKSGVSHQNTVDSETQLAALFGDKHSGSVNGMNNHENENDQTEHTKTNHDCNETENNKIDAINSLTNKESPIKHSIDNIIGDTDKNPERYIDEVISSLESIIMKNPRNDEDTTEILNGETDELAVNDIDDQNLLDALDAQIGDEENTNDNDKITLDDLLPKEDRSLELDDISEDDFNFDD